MQSETRWSCPPFDVMLTSAHLDVMARAILSGERDGCCRCPVEATSSAATGAGFGLSPVAISKPLVDVFVRGAGKWSVFFASTQALLRPVRNIAIRLKILHWIAGPPAMRPVPAAETWPIPRIETVGALAKWLGLDPSELRCSLI